MIFSVSFHAKIIAIIALITTIKINIAIAMSTISEQNSSVIEVASRQHRVLFIIYILFLAATVITTILVWRANNKYQEAVTKDADARITDAHKKTKELEQENLKLRENVAKLEIESAKAKKELLELQERLKPRLLTDEQAIFLAKAIKGRSPDDTWLSCNSGDEESCNFGQQIFKILKFAEWNIANNALQNTTIYTSDVNAITGIIISVNNLESPPSGVDLFRKIIEKFGFTVKMQKIKSSQVGIHIGAKPNFSN